MKQIQILWLGACHAFEENQRDLFWNQLASWYFKTGRGLFDCSALQTAIKLSKSIALQLDGFEKENNKFCCFKSFPEYRNADFGYLMSVCVAAQSNIQRRSLKCELASKKKRSRWFSSNERQTPKRIPFWFVSCFVLRRKIDVETLLRVFFGFEASNQRTHRIQHGTQLSYASLTWQTIKAANKVGEIHTVFFLLRFVINLLIHKVLRATLYSIWFWFIFGLKLQTKMITQQRLKLNYFAMCFERAVLRGTLAGPIFEFTC